ncbi:PTS sugar transporter subunit IIC [Amaricoccus macauensis]|uniref:PTS sugar transporter subunit IIC n=1 Tax=Amaricoccus macauensis TaxID=57001 RepID=UPI003C7C7973
MDLILAAQQRALILGGQPTMFILAIRDRKGKIIAIEMVSAWAICLSFAYIANKTFSILIVIFCVFVALLGSFLLFRMQNTLIINNSSSKEFAFPSSKRAEIYNTLLYFLVIFVFFLPTSILLIYRDHESSGLSSFLPVYIMHILSLFSVTGLFFDFFRRRKRC